MIDTTNRKCDYRDYDDESVPLSCFFYYQLTQKDVDSFPRFLAKIDDQNLACGDYLILVAVHVATREIEDWVWATFWWDNRAVTDQHAKGRPHRIKSRWKHYLMETTLSDFTPLERADGGPKICFNPYLETAVNIKNGVISNCMQCHRRAVFSEPLKELEGYDLGVIGRDGTTLASRHPLKPDYFKDALQTSFLWSIAETQNKGLMDILDAIENVDITNVK